MFAHWNPHQGVNPILRKATLEIPLLDSVVPTKGSAPMSFTRASVRRELDYSGLFVELLSGEVGFRGARRVRNLALYSSLNSAGASVGSAGGTTPPMITATTLEGQTVESVVFPVGGSGYAFSRRAGSSSAEFTKTTTVVWETTRRYTWRVRLALSRQLVGSEALVLYVTGFAGMSNPGITLNSSLCPTTLTDLAKVADAPMVSATGSNGLYAYIGSALSTPITLYLERFQIEEVTGQSNQNPSEDVSVGADKENLLLNTEQLNLWTSGGTLDEALDGVLGGVPAWSLTDNNAGAYEYKTQTITVPNDSATYYLRYRLKKQSGGTAPVPGINFNLTGGGTPTSTTVRVHPDTGVSVNGTPPDAIIDGGDYWDIALRLTNNSTGNTTLGLSVYPAVMPNAGPYVDSSTHTGTNTFTAFHLKRGVAPTTYFAVGNVYPFHGSMVDGVKWFTRENTNIVVGNVVQEITGVAVPEIPYLQVLKGYTPFPAATNLLTYSGDLTNAAWTKAASVASIATYPPRLLKESLPSQLRDDATAASIHGMFRNPTVTANTNYCAWLVVHSSGERFRGRIGFLDAATSSNGVICEFNARTGVTAAAAIGTGTLAGSGYIDVAKGWGIVYVSGKIDAATTAAQVQFLLADSAGNLVYDGDGVSRMILGHFQLENGTIPTNIIPTTGGTASVNADTLTCPAAGIVGASGGSLFAEGSIVVATGSNMYIASVNDGTLNERYDIGYVSNTGVGMLAVVDGGAAQANPGTANVAPKGSHLKIAARFSANDFAVVLNGQAPATDTAGTMPTVSVITIGSTAGAAPFHGPVAYFRAWDTPLTDAELKAITANGYRDQAINTLGWVDSPQISHDGRRLYFMYSRYDFAPLLIDGAGLADLKVTGGGRGWHVAIEHPSYDADVYCAYLRHDGTVERIENMRFDPNYDDFSLQVASAESSIMEVAATASLPKRVYYNANRYGDVPKLVYRQENADGSWTAESTSELATVSSGGSGAGYIDDNAFVSDSRLELVFASTRPGGQGSSDLWRSTRAGPTDVWGAPANIGTNINTAGHEDQVFLHPNGVDCWFTRDGGIYHCTRSGGTFNNDDTLVTFTGTPLAGGIGEPSTDEAMTGLYFSYLELATRRIRIMRAPWTGSKTAWGTPVAVD